MFHATLSVHFVPITATSSNNVTNESVKRQSLLFSLSFAAIEKKIIVWNEIPLSLSLSLSILTFLICVSDF
jgi:hypothetical protein